MYDIESCASVILLVLLFLNLSVKVLRRQQAGPAVRNFSLVNMPQLARRVALFSNIHVDFDLHAVFLSRCGIAHLHVVQRVNDPGIFCVFYIVGGQKG